MPYYSPTTHIWPSIPFISAALMSGPMARPMLNKDSQAFLTLERVNGTKVTIVGSFHSASRSAFNLFFYLPATNKDMFHVNIT
jgi:hypothetical protein